MGQDDEPFGGEQMNEFLFLVWTFSLNVSFADETSLPVEPLTILLGEPTAEQQAQGEADFEAVYKVLQHPRCLNCHPSGDAPLQGDQSLPHAMNITRKSTEAGLECAACHQTQNSDAFGIEGGPPGAPNWHLPSTDMPLVFEGRSVSELCIQLKDPSQNGQMSLSELYTHIAHDPLVLWGWSPGGQRTVPPLTHSAFAAHFKGWVELGAPCPTP